MFSDCVSLLLRRVWPLNDDLLLQLYLHELSRQLLFIYQNILLFFKTVHLSLQNGSYFSELFFLLLITYDVSGGGNGTPLQYSCLETPMDRGAWQAVVHGVTRSRTQLSDFTFTFHFHALGKAMATHSSVLAWRIPGMGEPGGLPSLGSHSRTRLKRLSSSSSNLTLVLGTE